MVPNVNVYNRPSCRFESMHPNHAACAFYRSGFETANESL